MLEADQAADLAVIDAKASQQIHGAVALVFEFAPRWPSGCWWPTGYRRLVGRGWSAHTNTWLLIDTEQRAIGGRVEQQLDDRHGFGSELRIAIIHPGAKDGPGEPGAA